MKRTMLLFPGDGIHQKDMLAILRDSDDFFGNFFQENLPLTEGVYDIPLMNEDREDTIVNQMRIVFSELAIASFWKSRGVIPSAVLGHSLGEYAAACFAGVFGIKRCMELVRSRGRSLEKTAGIFRMGVIHAGNSTVSDIIRECGAKTEISAVNGRSLVTVSGLEDDVKALLDECSRRGIYVNLTPVRGGGHNSFLRAFSGDFEKEVTGESFSSPEIPLISSVSMDKEMSPSQGQYWADQLLCPVDLVKAFASQECKDAECMIDVGVSPVLLGMAIEEFRGSGKLFIPSIRAGRNYRRQLEKAYDAAVEYNIAERI